MTAAFVTLGGFALVVAPGVRLLRCRLSGQEWARLAAGSLFFGFAFMEVGLVLLAVPAVLRALHALGLAAICEGVVTRLAPGGDSLGWTGAVLAGVILARALLEGRRAHLGARDAEVEPGLGEHAYQGAYEVVVLPTDRMLALTVPSERRQILLSDGLVQRLEPEELNAVIRHEAAHHEFHHWRYSLLAVAVERGLRPLPFVTRSTDALRSALEVWADEGATRDEARRRALLHRTIVTVFRATRDPAQRVSVSRAIAERIRRLEKPVRSRPIARAVAHGPTIILATFVLTLLLTWVAGAHHAIAISGYCPD